jgi:hypothetical protein
MPTHIHNFMKSILGEDGQQAFNKMIGRAPSIGALLAPRTILGWINTAARINYEGELPGVSNSYVSLSKSDVGIYGAVALEGVHHTFEGHDLVHVAAAISHALGVESIDIDPSLRDTDISKLGKSIDLLVKARTITHVAEEEMAKFANRLKCTCEPMSLGKESRDEVKTHHKDCPLAKTESPGQVAAARPPLEQQPGPKPQATQPVVNKPPMQKSARRELMVKHEDVGRDCRVCGQKLFRAGAFVGCMCFRALAKNVQTREIQLGFVLKLNGSDWDTDTVQTLISTFRR